MTCVKNEFKETNFDLSLLINTLLIINSNFAFAICLGMGAFVPSGFKNVVPMRFIVGIRGNFGSFCSLTRQEKLTPKGGFGGKILVNFLVKRLERTASGLTISA